MKYTFFILLLLPFTLFAESTKYVNFFEGSLTSAKQKATTEGKLFMVDFVANYCYMCKMMDETTFRNENVVAYTDKNYISLKVNVDDFDGFAWKQKYSVKVLPTILIFNSKGNIVGRYEESLGSARMLEILKTHDIPQNRSKQNPSYSTNSSEVVSTPSHVPTQPSKVEVGLSDKNSESVGEGLFEFSVKKSNSSGYGVQIGVFQDYANVLQEVAKLEAKMEVPVFVHISKLNREVVYRVVIGNFTSIPQAENFHSQVMKVKGYSGFVKKLSSLN